MCGFVFPVETNRGAKVQLFKFIIHKSLFIIVIWWAFFMKKSVVSQNSPSPIVNCHLK